MDTFEPRATFLGGKYRLDRLVADQDGVTIWEATDVERGLPVRLSVFRRSSTVVNHGRVDGGMFVVVDAPPRRAPRLELVQVSAEDAFFDEPPPAELFDAPVAHPPRRAGRWVAGAALCALVAAGGAYAARARPAPTGVTTITAARIAAPVVAPPEPTAAPPEIPIVEHVLPEVAAPRAAPRAPKRPTRTAPPPRRKPHVTANDPLTL